MARYSRGYVKKIQTKRDKKKTKLKKSTSSSRVGRASPPREVAKQLEQEHSAEMAAAKEAQL